jgi:hypothetical protein
MKEQIRIYWYLLDDVQREGLKQAVTLGEDVTESSLQERVAAKDAIRKAKEKSKERENEEEIDRNFNEKGKEIETVNEEEEEKKEIDEDVQLMAITAGICDEFLKIWDYALPHYTSATCPFDCPCIPKISDYGEEDNPTAVIPYEILIYIFTFLEKNDWTSASETCQRWKCVAFDRVFFAKFRSEPKPDSKPWLHDGDPKDRKKIEELKEIFA